jgi:hypothetical protein
VSKPKQLEESQNEEDHFFSCFTFDIEFDISVFHYEGKTTAIPSYHRGILKNQRTDDQGCI